MQLAKIIIAEAIISLCDLECVPIMVAVHTHNGKGSFIIKGRKVNKKASKEEERI